MKLAEICSLIPPERIFGDIRYVGSSNLMARCPFHGDDTPSLSVREDGLWFCFGCNEGGLWTDFLVRRGDAVDTREAYRLLCEMAGVKNGNGSNGGLWWKLLEDATSALLKNRRATEYLQKRGISEKTIKKYRIGLITEEMYQWIQRKDKSIRITRDFVNRIVFPVGYKLLVGRTLESEPEEKKYVNTPGFRKAETLYNLERVRGQEKVYVTEGIMDAILLTEAGYPAVAMLGSSLSEKQAELLQGFRVILTPDGDRAGKKGVRKSAEALRLAGFDLLYDVEVAVLPEKTDPAGLAAEHIDVLHRVMEDTLPCETFLCYLDRRYLEELFRKYMREGEISRAIYLFSPGVKTNRRFQRYMKLIEKLSELLEVKGGSGG